MTKKEIKTRCHPDSDSGFTKGDVIHFKKNYFCFHFANGNCSQGYNCSFSHHIPSLDECLTIDYSRDIFGRERFASHRYDREGIGNFMQATRTLKVCDMAIVYEKDKDSIRACYETLFRHFSLFGVVGDIFLIPSSCVAFIRWEGYGFWR